MRTVRPPGTPVSVTSKVSPSWVNFVIGSVIAAPGSLGPKFGDELDLHGDVEGQLRQADGTSRVASGLAKDLDQEVRTSVDYRWSLVESRGDVDHSEHFDNPCDPIEIAEFSLYRRQDGQSGHPSRLLTLLERE